MHSTSPTQDNGVGKKKGKIITGRETFRARAARHNRRKTGTYISNTAVVVF